MAQMRIDQSSEVGYEGLPGRARNWGLAESTVYLVDLTPGGTTLFEILWADDEQSAATLHPSDGDGHTWEFTPGVVPNGGGNAVRIRLTHTAAGEVVTTQIRIFGIPGLDGRVPPAPGELADPNASLLNAIDPEVIDRCERNWPTERFPGGQPFGWSDGIRRDVPSGATGLVPTYWKAACSTHSNISNGSGGAWIGISQKLALLFPVDDSQTGIFWDHDNSTFHVANTGLYVLDINTAFYCSQAELMLFGLRATRNGLTLAQQVSSAKGFSTDANAHLHSPIMLASEDALTIEFCTLTGGFSGGPERPPMVSEDGRHSNISLYRIA